MTSVFIYFANFTTLYSVLLGLLAFVMYHKCGQVVRVFCIYLLVAGSIDLVSFSFAESGLNNLVFFHLFTLMELGLLGVFFSLILKMLQVSFEVIYLIYLLLAGAVFNSVFIQPIDSFSTYSTTTVSIIVIAGCIYVFFKMLDEQSEDLSLVTKWFLSGLFIYHMGSVVVLLTADLLMTVDSEVQIIIWIIRTFIILLSKIVFTIGLVLAVKQRKKLLGYG